MDQVHIYKPIIVSREMGLLNWQIWATGYHGVNGSSQEKIKSESSASRGNRMMRSQANQNNKYERFGKMAPAFLLHAPYNMPYWMPEAGKLETTHPRFAYSSDVHMAVSASRHTHAKFSSLCCLFRQVHSWRHFGEIIIDGSQLHR